MKHNRRYKLFGWLPGLALLLTTACASVDDFDVSKVADAGKSTVTLNVRPQAQAVSTRGIRSAELTSNSHISDGSKVDVLIYAVYERAKDADESTAYTLVTDSEIAKGGTKGNVTAAEGQTVVDWEDDGSGTMTIALVLEADKDYKMAFWAQNSTTNAYTTSDLTAVKVDYTNAENNDELRDAFCANVDIKSKNATVDVVLYRPLAQINVGTTGWDYEGAAHLYPSPVSYTKSKITLSGVAQYYDVLGGNDTRGKVLVDNAHPLVNDDVTFALNTIPAFINFTDEEMAKLSYEKYDNEEMLIVDLDRKDGIAEYQSWDDYQDFLEKHQDTGFDATDLPYTETFKYLSMCYVLVPEAESNPTVGNNNNQQLTNGAVLNSVKFEAYGIVPTETTDGEDSDSTTDPEIAALREDGDTGLGEMFTLNNVPVQKNWRTNILGNSLFTFSNNYKLDIVPDYCGDYNYTGEKKEDENTSDDPKEVYGEIWFDDYKCGNQKQDALEPTDFFKYLYHNYSEPIPDGPSYHKHDISNKNDVNSASLYIGKYDGRDVGRVLKMQGRTGIAFTVEEPSTLTIVQAISRPTSTPPIADAVLMFYKQKEGETLTESTANSGITLLQATDELINMNNDEFTDNKGQTTEFLSTLLNPNKPTANYSATIYFATATIYGKATNNNTDTNQDVIIHTIYIEEPGTYIIRNGGRQFGAHNTESGLAYIKVKKGGHRLDIDWDWWQKKENPDYKDPEDNTESSDPDGE